MANRIAAPFQKGDRVVIISNLSHTLRAGTSATVAAVGWESGWLAKLDVCRDWISADWLKRVQAAK